MRIGTQPDYYAQSPPNDPAGPPAGSGRVVRGGGWVHPVGRCRSASRVSGLPGHRNRDLGFRLAALLTDKLERAQVEPTPDSAPNRAAVPPITITPRGEAPPPAVAPFSTEEAKQHQQRWADHLGVPVEHENSIGMKLVLIPPGEFMMGSSEDEIEELLQFTTDSDILIRCGSEGPRHRVRLARTFYLAMHEVTQDEYERLMGGNPSSFSSTGDGKDRVEGQSTDYHPVERVSWLDAVDFCNRLSARKSGASVTSSKGTT